MGIIKDTIELIEIEVGMMVLYLKEWVLGGFKS